MKYSLGSCTIDTEAYEIRRAGKLVPVEPQVFDLLVLLLRNRNRLVTKDEIFERIWNGRIVSDAALSSRVRSMREAIGDDGTAQALIRTIRGRGFRLVGAVTEDAGELPEVVAPGDINVAPRADIILLPPETTNAWEQPCFTRLDGMTPPRGISGFRRAAVCVGVVAIGLITTAWYAFQPGRGLPFPIAHAALGMPTGPGIAVLPFTNPAGDATLKFLGGALTEEIGTELTRYSELRVAARASTSEYDGNDIDARSVGRKLGVAFLVTGSLRHASDRVRVTAQLTKASDATLVWAETYERDLTPADMFAVQQDIAIKAVAAIASISSGVIARDSSSQARGKPPRELSAYECTVRANEIMTVFGGNRISRSATASKPRWTSEPDYAAAWAMLAWIHTIEYTQGINPRPDSDPRERALAPRAAPSSLRRPTRWRASPWRAPPTSNATSTCSTRNPRARSRSTRTSRSCWATSATGSPSRAAGTKASRSSARRSRSTRRSIRAGGTRRSARTTTARANTARRSPSSRP